MATAALRRGALLVAAALVLAGCGAQPRQDEDEPAGEFPVEVVRATFPERQSLAKDSRLEIAVRNAGRKTIPNINVTVQGFNRLLTNPLNRSEANPDLADPTRPVFLVNKSPVEFLRTRQPDNQSLVDREIDPPYGRRTAYVGTYSLGELEPDEVAIFRWDLTAVVAGEYELGYQVNAGLDGKAAAVTKDGGEAPTGTFAGVIDPDAPPARVAADGRTVVTADGRRVKPRSSAPGDQ